MRRTALVLSVLLLSVSCLTGCQRMANVMYGLGQAYNAQQAREASEPAGTTYMYSHQVTTGMTKQCFYSFGTSIHTKTMRAVDICPLSIKASP